MWREVGGGLPAEPESETRAEDWEDQERLVLGSREGWRAEGVGRERAWVPRARAPAWARVRPSLCPWGLLPLLHGGSRHASPTRLQGLLRERDEMMDV